MSFEIIYIAFLHFALKSTVVLLLACAVAWLMRKQAAGTRHLVWACAFVVLGSAPLWLTGPASWMPEPPKQPVIQRLAAPLTVHHVIQTRIVKFERGRALGASRTSYKADQTQDYGSQPIPWIGLFYMAGVLSVLLWLGSAGLMSRKMVKRSLHFDFDPLCRLAETAGTGCVQIRALNPLERFQGPLTLSFPKPVILVPEIMRDWDEGAQNIAVLHELAHIRRRDWVTTALAWLICAVYWFNPLTWVALSQLRKEAELACDDEVLSFGIAPTQYAEELLAIARALKANRGVCFAVPMARGSHVEGRIDAILASGRPRRKFSGKRALGVAGYTLLLASPLCAFREFADYRVIQPPAPPVLNRQDDPEARSFPVPKKLIHARNFKARLGDGSIVQLNGVSQRGAFVNSNDYEADFWAPNGGKVDDSETGLGSAPGTSNVTMADLNPDCRAFAFLRHSQKASPDSIYLATPLANGRLALSDESALSEDESGHLMTTYVNFQAARSRLYAAFGEGQWKTVATSGSLADLVSHNGSQVSIFVKDRRISAGTNMQSPAWKMTLDPSFLRDETRLVFLDKNGQNVETIGPLLLGDYEHGAEGLNAEDAGRVAKVLIQTRPTEWVLFSGYVADPPAGYSVKAEWGKKRGDLGDRSRMGSLELDNQGVIDYKLARGMWRPYRFVSPSGELWPTYPDERDANLEFKANGSLEPHTIMYSATQKSDLSDRATLKESVSVRDSRTGRWSVVSANDEGSYMENENGVTRLIRRITFYASESADESKVAISGADGYWTGPVTKPIRLTRDEWSSDALNITLDFFRRPTTPENRDHMVIPDYKGAYRLVLLTSSSDVIESNTSSGGAGEGVLMNETRGFQGILRTDNLGKPRKQEDIDALQFQTRPWDLHKTLIYQLRP